MKEYFCFIVIYNELMCIGEKFTNYVLIACGRRKNDLIKKKNN